MKFNDFRAALLVATSSLAMPATTAYAQDSNSSGQTGADIVVTGTRASLEGAEREKRDSKVLIDGISADDIGELPDTSIADTLVRIPGLTANDTEDGFDQVSVRGLGPDLTSTTYNGRTLPTNQADDRRVNLGTLPSEGIGAAYVQKTPDGATIEGGLGGSIDVRSVRPLETRRHGLTVVVRGTDDSIASQVAGPYGLRPLALRGEVSLIKRITPNLGIALDYSYLGTTSVSPSTQFTQYRTSTLTRADPNGDGVPDAYPASAGIRIGANTNNRHSVLGMVQWDPVSSVRISADGFFISNTGRSNNIEYTATSIANGANATPISAGVTNSTVTSFQGQVASYNLLEGDGIKSTKQYEGGLNLAFDDGGPIKFKVDVSYSRATAGGQGRSITAQNDATSTANQRIQFGYDITDPNHIALNFEPLAPEDYALSNISVSNSRRSDTIKAIRTDFTYDPHSSFISSIDFGARVDNRKKISNPDDSDYGFSGLNFRPDLDSSYLEVQGNPYSRVSQYLGGPAATTFPLFSVEKLLALENASGVKFVDHVNNDISGRSSVEETTFALYGELNLRSGPLSGNIGARYFITDQNVLGFSGTTEENKVPQRVDHSYSYLLPSANFKYNLTKKLGLRFAVSKTLSRTRFNSLRIGNSIDFSTIGLDTVVNKGNPDLKPFSGKNVDLSVEWYPNRHTSFAAQVFYKAVTNFVENIQTQGTVTDSTGTMIPVTINTQVNDPSVRHFEGIELIVRRDFNFLPGFLSNLGIRADYSHNWTDARDILNSVTLAADPNGLGTLDGGGSVTTLPDNFNPDVVNAQIYYSTRTIDLRLAYRYYKQFTRPSDNATQTHQYGQLDLSGGINLRRNVRLLGTIRNLTKTKSQEYYSDYRDLDSRSLFRSSVYDSREFTLGLRVQL